MKKTTTTLLLLTLLLGGCTSTSSTPETNVTESVSVASTAEENNNQAEAGREAVLAEIENDVTAKIESASEFSSASVGLIIPVGGTIQTGDDSRAKLDLLPDGTIIRLGPNSAFTLTQIEEQNGEPKTTFQLLFGKIFILLNGGSVDVETPSGVASVRGSVLSVQFDPDSNSVRAVCLEGHCELENEDGDVIELIEEQAAMIDEEGALSDVLEIDRTEIEDWLAESPELDNFLEELPDPEVFPEDAFDENGFGDGEFDPDLNPPDFDPGSDGGNGDGSGPGDGSGGGGGAGP